MRSNEAQGLVRKLITEADHLSRTSYAADREERSWRFAALRSTLQRLERGLGQEPPRFALVGELDLVYQRIVAMASVGAPEEKAELERMVHEAGCLRGGARSGTPPSSRRLRWALPLVAGGLAALLVPLAVRRARRSPRMWRVALGIAGVSIGVFVGFEAL